MSRSLNTVTSMLSKRYANVLVDLAEEGKVAAKVTQDVATLNEILDVSQDARTVFTSASLGRAEKRAVVDALAKQYKFQDITHKFLLVLIENGRLNALSEILVAYDAEVQSRSGQVTAYVTTAVKMTAAQTNALEKNISEAISAKVSVEAQVDEAIIGGLVVQIGSTMIDDSVKRKLERLAAHMQSGVENQAV